MIHTFLEMWSFCSDYLCHHKIVKLYTRIKDRSPISCTGAAVSCLKLTVEFQMCQSFAKGGQCCAKKFLPCCGSHIFFFFKWLWKATYIINAKQMTFFKLQLFKKVNLLYCKIKYFIMNTGSHIFHYWLDFRLLIKSKRFNCSHESLPAFTCSLDCCGGVLLVGVVEYEKVGLPGGK